MASKVEILGGQLDGSTLDNAASESTLRELVEAIKKLEGTTKSGGGKSGGGGKAPEIDTNPANAALEGLGKGLGKGASAVVGGLSKLSGAALGAAGAVATSLGKMGGLIANGNNNLSQFVGALNTLPGPLGAFAGAVASGIAVLEEYQQTQRDLSKTGASFNNSMMEMRMTAARSGLNLSEFASVLKENAQSIGGLGDTITDGAKKLADVGNAVGASGLDESFMKLGMSATDARKAAMKFSTELVKGDKVRGASASELASASLDYEKDLDLLAKQTGKSKDALRAFSDGLIKDGGAMSFAFAKMSPQMQAAMKGIMNTVGGTMGKGAQEALADVFSGAAAPSTEASAMFQAQMPGVVATFKQMQETAAWDAKTTEEKAAKQAKMDSLNAQASFEQLKYLQSNAGQMQMKNIQRLSPAQREFMLGLQAQSKSLQEQGIDINTASKADIERVMSAKRAEQEKQAALDKGLNAFQATITKLFGAVQQAFFGALAPRLEKLAEKITGFTSSLEGMGISVETIIPVIGYLADLFGTVLGSVFEGVALVGTKIYNAFTSLMTPVLGLLGSLGLVDSTATDTAGKFGELVGVVVSVSNVIFDVLGGAIDFLAVIIGGVVNGFTGLVNMTKFLFNMFGITGDSLNGLKDIGGKILNAIRGVFSKEGATAIVESISSLFNFLLGSLFTMLGNIPGLGDLKKKGQEMIAAADQQKKAADAAGAAMQGEVDKRNANVNAQNDAAKKEIAGSDATYRKNAELGKKELADRKAREAADAESAANRKNAIKDQASADAMERSQAAAIKGMRERAGIETTTPAVAPSPGMGGTVPGAAGAGAGAPLNQDQQKNLELIKASLVKQGITDPKMIAATLGNVMKESGGKTQDENLNYKNTSNDRIRGIFKSATAGKSDAEINEMKSSPEKMAEANYGSNTKLGAGMGNTEVGDGWKYRGRGFIQITGKNNYSAASKAIFGDDRLVKNPDMANDPAVAAEISAWFMKRGTTAMAAKMGIDPTTDQASANLVATSVIAGGDVRKKGDYLAKEVVGKVDKSAGSAQIQAIANGTGSSTAVASATPQTTAAKPTPPGATVPNGTAVVAATTQPTTQVASADQAAKDKADKDKAQAEKDKAAQTASAPVTNPMSEVIASLNTSLAQLTMLQARAVSIAEQQLRATSGLSRDAYKAV
jgi:predicted chitinase